MFAASDEPLGKLGETPGVAWFGELKRQAKRARLCRRVRRPCVSILSFVSRAKTRLLWVK